MKNKLLIIVFIIIILLLVGYIIYDKRNDYNTKFPEINVEILSMSDPTIFSESGSLNLGIRGQMSISYDEDTYDSVVLKGYCLGNNNEKYDMDGPTGGPVSFYNKDTEYSLSANNNEVNWHNVVIKSCKIDKAIAYISETDKNTGLSHIVTTIETEINYEKSF